jgi:hypothetical protein
MSYINQTGKKGIIVVLAALAIDLDRLCHVGICGTCPK